MHDLVIMYSGGLDSLIAYHYARAQGYNPLCVNVNFGHDYTEKEEVAIDREGDWYPEVKRIHIDGLWELISLRLSNQIIPSRNVLLAVIGSMISGRVWINALDGEQAGKEHDKSDEFFDDVTSLLTFTNNFFQPESIIESPFRHLTKGESIAWAIEYGIPLEVLFSTSSCYDAKELKCGKCLTCVKRYLAFKENGVTEEGYANDPMKSAYFYELKHEIPLAIKYQDYRRFSLKRCESFIKLINS